MTSLAFMINHENSWRGIKIFNCRYHDVKTFGGTPVGLLKAHLFLPTVYKIQTKIKNKSNIAWRLTKN